MELSFNDLSSEFPSAASLSQRSHRKIVTSTFDLAVDSIVDRIEQGAIHLKHITDRPKFQRNYVWDDRKASKLVESILLNVPLPVFYFSEDRDYNFDVIDGQQRIYSLYRFVKDKFKLLGLEAYTEFNGLYFSDLPDRNKRQFNAHILRCIIIRNESHPRIKFDVFERLNTNSTPLTAQEIRNCIYEGKFNDMLGELANDNRWLLIRNRDFPDKRLTDEEMVLRFFSFVLQDRKNYYSPLKNWLNDTAIIGNSLSKKELELCKKIWIDTLDKSLIWFKPKECFRRPDTGRLNKAVFDLVTYSAYSLDFDSVNDKKIAFRKKFKKLFNQDDFINLLDYSVDKKYRFFERIKLWNKEMSGIGL